MSLASDVPERIRGLRDSLGLSQAALAELLGVSKLSIFRWEHGRARPRSALWRLVLQVESGGVHSLDHPSENGETPAHAARARIGRSASTPTNLPHPATSFIGRQRELAAIEEQLRHTRLLTVTGPGGCGKTRLAIEVGWRASFLRPPSNFVDGVCLLELGALRDPAHILTAVARTFAIPLEPLASLRQLLTAALGPRRLLLVLDNCEHLLDGCRTLVTDLLEATSQLTILATSREPLAVTAEQLFLLAPLSAGGRGQGTGNRGQGVRRGIWALSPSS